MTIIPLHAKPNCCRWPIGDPKLPGFMFCGEERGMGSSYCDDHHRIAYTPLKRRERADKSIPEIIDMGAVV